MSTSSDDSEAVLSDEEVEDVFLDDSDDEEERAEKLRRLEEFVKEQDKRGIVYLSRIPRFMKLEKLRHLLSQFGEIDRIYLTPEDLGARKRRLRAGGNRKQLYIDGWVEFKDRKIARRVTESLNNTPVGGKKMGFFHDDIWNMRYLKGFKWRHLTEQLAQEQREKRLKLRAEVTEARKESEEYLGRVHKARAIDGVKRSRKRSGRTFTQSVRREFKQKEAPSGDGGGLSDGFLASVLGGKRKR